MTFCDLTDVTPEGFCDYLKVSLDLFDLCIVHEALYNLIKQNMQCDHQARKVWERIDKGGRNH